MATAARTKMTTMMTNDYDNCDIHVNNDIDNDNDNYNVDHDDNNDDDKKQFWRQWIILPEFFIKSL
jgi:hypothetical protein